MPHEPGQAPFGLCTAPARFVKRQSWPRITSFCSNGSCVTPPSCTGLAATYGAGEDESCCKSPLVEGGTFHREPDKAFPDTLSEYPATVSDFRLDKYEITVGRFWKFVAQYSQSMISAGAGKNPNNKTDPGWDVAWNAAMPADREALISAVKCQDPTRVTLTAGNDALPINCISWYVAEAFCVWDGGRLPTEAEWELRRFGARCARNP